MTARCTGACGWEPGCFGCQVITPREELLLAALLAVPVAGIALIVGLTLGFDRVVGVVLLLTVLTGCCAVLALAAIDLHRRGMARVAAARPTAPVIPIRRTAP